jgi:16S rRNA (cytosine967-C5)-methyltransferase
MEPAALGALIASTLEEAGGSDRRADQIVKAALRRASALSNEERALLGRVVHGARCFARTLAFILGDQAPPASSQAAAWSALVGELDEARAVALWPDAGGAWRAAHHEGWRDRLPADASARLAIEQSVPTWLATRLIAERGLPEATSLLAAMNRPGPMWLRTNPLLGDRDALRAALEGEGAVVEEGPLPTALRVDGRLNVRGSAAWQGGGFEVQDLGSQLIAAAVHAGPGELVVDVCAGRGGKTLALASAMVGEGTLVAFDVDEGALDALAHRALKARAPVDVRRGASIAAALWDLQGRCDRVLVDAPCTSLGTLRRGPDLRWRCEEAVIARCAASQRGILGEAARLVRPGGRLVYATCSVLAEENDAVADAFEASHPAYAPAALHPGAGFRWGDAARVTIGPHTDDTDGFFMAAWNKVLD